MLEDKIMDYKKMKQIKNPKLGYYLKIDTINGIIIGRSKRKYKNIPISTESEG
jgi:hypothetical protein